MGTRHLVAVVQDGDYRVAQYGQWDGYPSGQGETIREFLATADLARFKDRIRTGVFFLNKEEVDAINAEIDAKGGLEEAGYGHLSRDVSGDLLQVIQDRDDRIGLINKIDFVGDSLFCEYAYVVNLDNDTLEVYEGFNQEPLAEGERFRDYYREEEHRSDQYHPVKHIRTIPFAELAEFNMGDLVKNEDEEEEEEDAPLFTVEEK